MVEDFNRVLINEYEVNCPAKPMTSSRDACWWNKNVARISIEIRKLFKNWRRKTAISAAKQNSFRKFYERIDQPTEASYARLCASGRAISSAYLRRNDVKFPANEDRVHLLLKIHFPRPRNHFRILSNSGKTKDMKVDKIGFASKTGKKDPFSP